MAKQKQSKDFPVIFVGLKEGEQTPNFAAYQTDSAGRPVKKIGGYNGKLLSIEIGELKTFALGPDIENFKELPKENLVSLRTQNLELWRKQGAVLARDIWNRFYFNFVCVSGTVRKCRPWYWELIDDIRLAPMFTQAQVSRIIPINSDLNPHIIFPLSCQPLCDGVIEIYERVCCCVNIYIPDLIARLRGILRVLPVPIPDPIGPVVNPFPTPVPTPVPTPGPGPDPGPYTPQLLRRTAREIVQRKTALDLAAVPPKNLYEDYLALNTMTDAAARQYVLDRPYLFPIFCHCSVRKVGETNIQPGGHFDFCYLKCYRPPHIGYCYTTYAYKIKQLINGVMTVVYDGTAAHQYFSAGVPADIKTFNPQAQICAEGTGDPPPNDGTSFVMLEYIGSHGTYHFNFPVQTGVSQVGLLDANDGAYSTADGTPDCPWGTRLGLRLWFSPDLEPVVKYYRLKVVKVNDSGMPVGSTLVLNDTVSWDKLIEVSGDIVRVPETLGPNTVGSENDLFKVPYWSSPDHQYLSGQFHQIWNTAQTKFPDGRYMLVIEVFDGAGNRIKPNGAAGPGTGKNFQFRRWVSSVDTDPVPFADAAHIFYVDNTPVGGDIVDLRQNGSPNTAECQFMSGTAADTLAIGFRAYHIHGAEHAGNGDSDSFMKRYDISWQRGLNGPTGILGPAPSGGNNHTDVGETGPAVSSGSQTFANLLNGNSKCTFSVTLHVSAKHFNGSHRIWDYDYWETASFALEI